MAGKIMAYFDRNTVIFVIITSIILLFYSLVLLGLYLLILISIGVFVCVSDSIELIKIKNWIRNAGVVVISTFIIIILGEIWLQLYPRSLSNMGGLDILGEFSDYTARGYLTEAVFKKRENVVRILGLADSFAICLKDKGKNYHDILQQKYLANGKGAVEIINAGMEGIGPGYYWHILKQYGDLFKPDVILVGFFVGNDFDQADLFVVVGNYIVESKDRIKRYSTYYKIDNLRLYKFFRNKYIMYQEEKRKEQEVKQLTHTQVGSFSDETFLEVEKSRCWIFDKNNFKLLNKKWQECSEIVLKMKNWCEAREIKLVIAIFPDQFQVDEQLREAVFAKYHYIKRELIDLNYPDNLIVNFCKSHGINCIDLLGKFQENGKNKPLYSLRDTHWNEAGNRLAADVIFEYLEENQLVPSRPRQ